MSAIIFDNVSFCYAHAPGGNAPDGNALGSSEQDGYADAFGPASANTLAEAPPATNAGTPQPTGVGAPQPAGAGAPQPAGASEQDTSPITAHPPQKNTLDGVSLRIEPGEFVAVIGANGSGKSTLAKHINALLKPSTGKVITAGMDTANDELVFEIRSQAGMIFQNPDSQIVSSVVEDDVAFGPENLAVPYAEMCERVDRSLDTVKIHQLKERNPAHLSGGQKQRVCIAGILAMQPNILILDEPSAMLDVRGRRGIRRLVRELNKSGITVVLITHFMEEAVLASRVICMSHGQIALTGKPAEVFANKEMLRELDLEVPFSLQLAEALIARGVNVPSVARPEELKEELRWQYSNLSA